MSSVDYLFVCFTGKLHIFPNINFGSEPAVNDFIAHKLQLDDDCKSRISVAIERIYGHLQHDFREYGVHNLVKVNKAKFFNPPLVFTHLDRF